MNVVIFTDIPHAWGFGRNLGAYKIASDLRRVGHTVQVIDFFTYMTNDELEVIIDKYVDNQTAVCFSTTYLLAGKYDYLSQRYADHLNLKDIYRMIREKKPVKIIIGGHKAHDYKWLTWEEMNDDVEHIIYGEADDKVSVFLKTNLDRIVDLGRAKHFAETKMFWHESDHIFQGEHIPIEISRGCPFGCDFCSYAGTERTKPVQVIKEEMIRNYELFGVNGYMISDGTFNSSRRKAEDFCNMFVSLPFDIEYSCFARIDKMYFSTELFLESGCKSVHFGIETINPKVLKKIKKCDINVVDELKRVTTVWGDKITTMGSFIVGLEGDSVEDVTKMGEWLLSNDNPLTAFTVGSLINNKIKSPHWKDRIQQWTVPIVDEINTKRIQKFAGFHYSRMRNLGYSPGQVHELNSMVRSKQKVKPISPSGTLGGNEKFYGNKTKAEAMIRRNILKFQYMEKLL